LHKRSLGVAPLNTQPIVFYSSKKNRTKGSLKALALRAAFSTVLAQPSLFAACVKRSKRVLILSDKPDKSFSNHPALNFSYVYYTFCLLFSDTFGWAKGIRLFPAVPALLKMSLVSK
jgi:hypothetical protein